MAGLNKVMLIGNLGKDPEVRHLEGGTAVATFSLATSETYNDRDGNRQTITEWHNVVLWRGLATVAERFLKKGSKVYIEGKLTTRSYQAQDGTTRYVTEVVARDMVMLDSRDAQQDRPPYIPPTASDIPSSKPAYAAPVAPAAGGGSEAPVDLGSDDDLPF